MFSTKPRQHTHPHPARLTATLGRVLKLVRVAKSSGVSVSVDSVSKEASNGVSSSKAEAKGGSEEKTVNAITTAEKVDVNVVNEKASEKEKEETSVGVPPLPYQPERRVTNDSENSKGELPGYEDAAQPQVDGVKNAPAEPAHSKSELDTQVERQQPAPEEPVEYFEPRAAYDFADEDVDSASEYSVSSEHSHGDAVDEDVDVEGSSGKYYYETRGRLTPCAEDEELDEFEGHENEDAEDLERVWVEVLEEQRRAQEQASSAAAEQLTTNAMPAMQERKAGAMAKSEQVMTEGRAGDTETKEEQVTKKTKRKSAREVGGKSEGIPHSRSPTHVEEAHTGVKEDLPQASEAFPLSGEGQVDPEDPREAVSDIHGDDGEGDAMQKTRLAREAPALEAAKAREEAKRQKEKEEEERDLTPEEEARLIAHWERRRVLYERHATTLETILTSNPSNKAWLERGGLDVDELLRRLRWVPEEGLVGPSASASSGLSSGLSASGVGAGTSASVSGAGASASASKSGAGKGDGEKGREEGEDASGAGTEGKGKEDETGMEKERKERQKRLRELRRAHRRNARRLLENTKKVDEMMAILNDLVRGMTEAARRKQEERRRERERERERATERARVRAREKERERVRAIEQEKEREREKQRKVEEDKRRGVVDNKDKDKGKEKERDKEKWTVVEKPSSSTDATKGEKESSKRRRPTAGSGSPQARSSPSSASPSPAKSSTSTSPAKSSPSPAKSTSPSPAKPPSTSTRAGPSTSRPRQARSPPSSFPHPPFPHSRPPASLSSSPSSSRSPPRSSSLPRPSASSSSRSPPRSSSLPRPSAPSSRSPPRPRTPPSPTRAERATPPPSPPPQQPTKRRSLRNLFARAKSGSGGGGSGGNGKEASSSPEGSPKDKAKKSKNGPTTPPLPTRTANPSSILNTSTSIGSGGTPPRLPPADYASSFGWNMDDLLARDALLNDE